MCPARAHRSALLVLPLVDVLDEVDADADALLDAHGLDRGRIRDASLRLPAAVVNEMFSAAEDLATDRAIGARAGLSIRRGVLDVFDYAVRSAATLGDAWDFAAQFNGLLDDAYKRTLRIEGERAFLEYHRAAGDADGFAEFVLTAVGTVARQMTGQILTAERVTLRRDIDGAGAALFT
ncbi:MAG: AraC family transcriptional regulator ligand-binding domain-containing protein, partial [Polyangiaceae bacterium]